MTECKSRSMKYRVEKGEENVKNSMEEKDVI